MNKKRIPVNLTAANRSYLKKLAWDFGTNITAEINRIIAERRLRDIKEASKSCSVEQVQ